MRHYLSTAGEIYAYEPDGSQDDIIPADFVPINDADLAAHRAAQAAAAAARPEAIEARARALIEQAERQSLRSLRELVLSLVDPAAVDAATVAHATTRLRAADTAVRAEAAKLGPRS